MKFRLFDRDEIRTRGQDCNDDRQYLRNSHAHIMRLELVAGFINQEYARRGTRQQ